MVLSTTKKVASASSITNQSTNGGNKKAGLLPKATASAASATAFKGTSSNYSLMKKPVSSTTRSSYPIGMPGGRA
jgi:hypothetical protein